MTVWVMSKSRSSYDYATAGSIVPQLRSSYDLPLAGIIVPQSRGTHDLVSSKQYCAKVAQ